MRLIDIYREDTTVGASGFRLIDTAFIQTGDAAVTRSLTAKSFTMADGSLLMYPASKEKIQTAIQLECTASQARSLENALTFGQLLFAGMRAGARTTPTPTDALYSTAVKYAFSGYLTGDCKTNQIAADLFAMELALQLDSSISQIIPVILPDFSAFCIADELQKFSDFLCMKGGIFRRKHVIFTKSKQIGLTFPLAMSITLEGVTGLVSRNGVTCESWNNLTKGSICEASLFLDSGMNLFDVVIQNPTGLLYYAYRPLHFQFYVYQLP